MKAVVRSDYLKMDSIFVPMRFNGTLYRIYRKTTLIYSSHESFVQLPDLLDASGLLLLTLPEVLVGFLETGDFGFCCAKFASW